MRRSSIGVVMAAALTMSCLGGSGPTIQTGPDAVTTPSGLHLVDRVPAGKLYLKPDYNVGTYSAFKLGKTSISFLEGSRQLDEEQQAQLIRIFEEIARETIERGGTKEAEKLGPCVARVNLRLDSN